MAVRILYLFKNFQGRDMIYFTRQEQRIIILLGIVMLLGIGLLLVKRFQPGWVLQFSLGKPDFDVEEDEVSPRLKNKPPELEEKSDQPEKSDQVEKADMPVAVEQEQDQQKEAEKPAPAELEIAIQPPVSVEKSRININAAARAELETLSGIGPVLAQRIIDYRERYGNFKNIREIKAVRGIGEATFQKLSDKITVTDQDGSE